MKYNQPFDQPGNPNAPYVNGNPSVGTPGSIPPAAAFESPQRELVALISDAGLTPTDTDLEQVPKAIQSGKLNYGIDSSAVANSIVMALTPAPVVQDGLIIRTKAAHSSTGPSTVTLNGNTYSIVRRGNSAIQTNDILALSEIELRYNSSFTAFELFGVNATFRPALAANLDIYVRMDGSDSNDGTADDAAHALRNPQAAVNLAFNYAPSQFGITIHIHDGSYGPAVTPSYPGPTLTIIGTSAAAVLLDGGTNSPAVGVVGPNTMTVSNVTGQNSAPAGTSPIFLSGSGAVMFNNNTASNATINAVLQAFGGTFNIGTHTFKGNCGSLFFANVGGHIQFVQTSVFTINNALTVSTASAQASDNGSIGVPTPSAPTFVNPGNISGPRFLATTNGVINSSGAGNTYFPGTVAGSLSTGGQYV